MFKEPFLKGEVVIITGGGTGLGRSMGLRFAELGASLVLTSRKKENLEKAGAEMKQRGARFGHAPQVLTIPCDIRKPEEVEAMVEKTMKEMGRIDVLINNAAGNFLCPTEMLSYNAFNAVVGIVLHGSFNCTLAAGRKMIESGRGGRILSIVTTYVWTGSAYVVPSACGKAGVAAMTQSLAVEWARYKIRLNAIAPGPFHTEGAWKNLVPPGVEEKMLQRIPLRRLGRHEELADLAAYLISPYAAYINGEIVTIDGGEWLQGAGQFNWASQLTPEDWQAMTSRK
ncbi:MAG: SDR family oxidoreductase [Deltaproteobacteria bacterium]|nr:SDR family oxidoreductase [Deltaproteobacteria bacterium]